jgi:hypothetical protein
MQDQESQPLNSDPPKMSWWGYLHTDGHIQVKRYFDPLDLKEAHESPFVERVFPPFAASG